MDFNNFLFRSSGNGNLMSEPTTIKAREAGELAEGVKSVLIDLFVSAKYNRYNYINGDAIDKGNETEEDSITTISRVTKKFYKKNEIRLENPYISGTPDLYEGNDIYTATVIRDAKSSWDLYSFSHSANKPLSKLYYWQGQSYMALTGAKKCYFDFCLNNTPYHIVEGLLRKESYNHLNGDTPEWIELQIIANHVYDFENFNKYINERGIFVQKDKFSKSVYDSFVEINIGERIHTKMIEFNEEDVNRLYERIKQCRNFLNQKNNELTSRI